MHLKFNETWRFRPPTGNQGMDSDVVDEFLGLVVKVAVQRDGYHVYEHFKKHFSHIGTSSYYPSTSLDWAKIDLQNSMSDAALNAPLFIEAFYDACNSLGTEYSVPSPEIINTILLENSVPYQIQEPWLVSQGHAETLIDVTDRPPSLAEEATGIYRESLSRSKQLLEEGRNREAVTELLWLLESIATEFRGVEVESELIKEDYFNSIVKKLRRINKGKSLDVILGWMNNMYGYLSSPQGGGIRHGARLANGIQPTYSEALLFCNLIRSYMDFLLAESNRLQGTGKT